MSRYLNTSLSENTGNGVPSNTLTPLYMERERKERGEGKERRREGIRNGEGEREGVDKKWRGREMMDIAICNSCYVYVAQTHMAWLVSCYIFRHCGCQYSLYMYIIIHWNLHFYWSTTYYTCRVLINITMVTGKQY